MKVLKVKEREREEMESPTPIEVAASPSPTGGSTTPTPIGSNSSASEKVLFDTRIKRKNVLALNEKVAAIREYEKMPVYKRVGRMFHCSPDQIKRIVLQKDGILKAWEQRTRRCQDAKTLEMKVVRVSMLGKAVYDWIRRMMYYQDIQLTDGLIQKTALQFKSAMGLQNFFPHKEWCDKFRQTYKITEVDSKLLKIGYTQGHSVQIKDVMKDVLSECTPDADKQADASAGNENKDENENDMKVDAALHDKEQPVSARAPKRTRTKAIATTPAQRVSPRPIAPLQNIRQLVALPLQGNRVGMPQKVLVATPITPAGQVPGTTPMTMTIIPLATIANSQSMQAATATSTTAAAPKIAATAAVPSTGAAATMPTAAAAAAAAVSATATNSTATAPIEKQIMPPPILEIKKEIKLEPDEDEPVHIKQECITDEEVEDDDDMVQQISDSEPECSTNASSIVATVAAMMRQLPNRNGNNNNSNSLDEDVNMNAPPERNETDDDENIALSNLRRLIQIQGTIVATATTTASTSASTSVSVKQAANAQRLPAVTIIPRHTPQTASRAGNLTTPTTATKTPVSTLTTLPPPPLTKAPDAVINRLANKRKQQTDMLPMLPPIKTCIEARKYLKLLEDFALYKENFRLIGLITRADEVLRELDGDDDVDVD